MSADRAVLAPLEPGARVALVATSGPIVPELLARSLALLEAWGLEPVVLPSATARHSWATYLAGEDAIRARDLQQAWCDPDVDAVFCVRGGYGSVRVLDLLDVEAMRAAHPKPLLGSSDVTGVHEWIGENLGVPGWFTPMLATVSLLDDPIATTSLRDAVLGPARDLVLRRPETEVLVHDPGEVGVQGRLVGGNLSLLSMTLGAKGRPPVDHRGCIVLLEDVGEETYRVDGFLQSVLRAGVLDGVAGIALGGWHECGPLPEIRSLVLETLSPLGVPVLWEVGFGHGPAAPSVPLGVTGTVRGGAEPALVVRAQDYAGTVAEEAA